MTTDLRSFTNEGLREFQQFLHRTKKAGMSEEGRDDLLQGEGYTRVVPADIRVAPRDFENRLEVGEHFLRLFRDVDETLLQSGVWAWLSLYYFDSVCPPDDNGRRQVGDITRYIPDPANFQRYYRHLLRGPFTICRAYREDPEIALAVLCPPVDKPGDVVENLVSRQDLVTCPTVMEVATILYVNKKGKHRRGAANKSNGGARRLASVLMQLDVTYDLFDISAQDLLDMLPEEFDIFRTATD